MSEEKCPGCGAELLGTRSDDPEVSVFECMAEYHKGRLLTESIGCATQQLAQKDEQIKQLQEACQFVNRRVLYGSANEAREKIDAALRDTEPKT